MTTNGATPQPMTSDEYEQELDKYRTALAAALDGKAGT